MADGNEFAEKLEWAYKAMTYHPSPITNLMIAYELIVNIKYLK